MIWQIPKVGEELNHLKAQKLFVNTYKRLGGSGVQYRTSPSIQCSPIMLANPAQKYSRYQPVDLPDRQWPSRIVTQHPTWLSTDLRDGNQSIPKPMTVPQKLALFRVLVARGFKEIEVAYPSASQTEFDFVRSLIENQEIPDDVAIQVLMPARKEHILRTFEATRGAKHVLVQLYCSSATPIFRDVVYKNTKDDAIRCAAEYTHLTRLMANEYTSRYGTEFQLVYGLEGFSQSELDFVIEVCSQVKNAWESHGSKTRPIIFNLGATVECAPANHFADQIEYFHRNLPKRDETILSVHVHNDRGTAVAATEHALLAGAERVEGCLFGNGERTGNVDLVTLALNLYSQGISPGLDMSNLNDLVDFMTKCTGLPVHPRHPYAGELVYTAFSGGHQDGIRKGLHLMEERIAEAAATTGKHGNVLWIVPYIPVDPSDLGRVYVSRINSQSGKGGAAHVVEQYLDLDIPRPMQVELSSAIQTICDSESRELSAKEICLEFTRLFHFHESAGDVGRVYVQSCQIHDEPDLDLHMIDASIIFDGKTLACHSNLQVEVVKSLLHTLNEQLGLGILLIEEQLQPSSLGIASFVRVTRSENQDKSWWGVGRAEYQAEATLRAIISAINCVLG